MAVTLQDILQTSFAADATAHKMPRRVWRAAHAVTTCRTATLGRARAALSTGPRDGDLVQLVSASGLPALL